MVRVKKIWYQAECWVTEAKLLLAQCAFKENGAIGLHIDDGINPLGQKKYPDDCILLKAYFDHINEDELSRNFAQFFNDCRIDPPAVSFDKIPEEDWQGNFVRSCKSFMIEPDIYIVPSFDEEFKKNLPPLFLEIDPENAFGTGQHQTTKLCLTAIRQILDVESRRIRIGLDVGCGSGILSILMKKLGVLSVIATDTDEDSIICAKKMRKKMESTSTPCWFF